ncbi:MAG: DUF86 domain-containing protein [Bacteroidaceae bacterium]|nr:DUF86 domain-containing protein [Bacteroidaceae bacterium]
MCEESIVYALLKEIEASIVLIAEQTACVQSPDYFTSSQDGMFALGGVCMQLIFIAEKVKSLDTKTNGTLLAKYPEIPWKDIIGLRNIIAHEYHRVDEEEIFAIIKNDLPHLLATIRQMQKDL